MVMRDKNPKTISCHIHPKYENIFKNMNTPSFNYETEKNFKILPARMEEKG